MTDIDVHSSLSAPDAAAVLEHVRSGASRSNASSPGLSAAALAVAAKPMPTPMSPIVLAGIVRMGEFALIVLVGMALYGAYVAPFEPLFWRYLIASFVVAVLSTLAFQVADIYQVQAFRGLEKQYMRMASAWSIVFLITIGASFFAKAGDMYSRVWLGGYYMVGILALVASRKALYYAVRKWTREGRLTRRTVIVGGGKPGESVIEDLRRQKDAGIEIIGLFDDRGDDRSAATCAGEPKLGSVSDLVEFGRRTRVDLVIFSLPISAEGRILQMLKKLWVLPLDIRLAAHTNKLQFRPRSYSYIGNVPVIDVFDRPIADWDVVMKWLFDKIIGGLMLIAALPIMAAVAIAIKLDSKGPVFFKQKRYGFNNDLIEVYKFRSMYTDKTDATAAKLVTKDDPRVTKVGRFIRKTSLDELPQLINVVIKGNLSLVGPRPHAVNAKAEARLYDEAVDGYFARHRVKPGITGWAQINGWRGETDTHEKIQKRVEHDLYYIENWSVLFDLMILWRTPGSLLKTENAY
ncbi:undecaprenyl-phosphate glucose phosphotransferase [Pseudolabrys taiwanensis]|uniref:Undecaprenyl-phosphate glucose phosphotransferase n=1 Tax=Pseudolabrys taiwanensis TaxID=331696 RepID=A0A345ZTH5_9HYPH|nr:undecaprenyl-phosphate glucose phosphotransferase [Pseudolabrys taiwanensis]AXK80222.1 undecaprenyl-phosphate glucose phosphotransferase [Pseudolabrys taiwanensis]